MVNNTDIKIYNGCKFLVSVVLPKKNSYIHPYTKYFVQNSFKHNILITVKYTHNFQTDLILFNTIQ